MAEKTLLEAKGTQYKDNARAIKGNPAKNACKKPMEGALKQGIVFGLVPHIGCIGFVIASILGATIAMEFFKPLLLNAWFLYALIAVSLLFATLSIILYLKKNKIFSVYGIKRKKKYIATMYATTLGINLLFFFAIFPATANFGAESFAGTAGEFALDAGGSALPNVSVVKLQVDIPCSGHASLVSSELKKLDGVKSVKFSAPNFFDVECDLSKTSKEKILSLDIFKEYKAKIVFG